MVATQRFIAPRGIDALLALFKTTAIDANEHIRFAESSSDSAIYQSSTRLSDKEAHRCAELKAQLLSQQRPTRGKVGEALWQAETGHRSSTPTSAAPPTVAVPPGSIMSTDDVVDLTGDGGSSLGDADDGVIDLSESPAAKMPKKNPEKEDAGIAGTSEAAPAAADAAASVGDEAPGAVASLTYTPSNRLLAQLRRAREARQQNCPSSSAPAPDKDPSERNQPSASNAPEASTRATASQEPSKAQQAAARPPFSLMTFNVWFNHEAAVRTRMQAIADIIQAKRPTFVALQEMTPFIYNLLSNKSVWSSYHATPPPAVDARGNPQYFTTLLWSRDAAVQKKGQPSELPFANSVMGRSIHQVQVSVGGSPLLIATSHLESPLGWNQTFHNERMQQCREGFRVLTQRSQGDVIWAGDMNLSRKDTPTLPDGWEDAWEVLRPGEPGYTYDGRSNAMLTNNFRDRLDRVFCRLQGWKLKSIEMLGTEAIPGAMWTKDTKKGPIQLPVLPSDHYGLICSFEPHQK